MKANNNAGCCPKTKLTWFELKKNYIIMCMRLKETTLV